MSALAIVVYDAKTRMPVEAQNYLIAALKKKPIKIFMDMESAVSWLQTTLQQLPENTSTSEANRK